MLGATLQASNITLLVQTSYVVELGRVFYLPPTAAKGSISASCLFSGYLKATFHPQDPSSPPLSWLQHETVGCGTVPSLGCLVVLCTQGVCWQSWTQLPTGYHLAQRMGDLYPMGFPKVSQPVGAHSIHLPSCFLFPARMA